MDYDNEVDDVPNDYYMHSDGDENDQPLASYPTTRQFFQRTNASTNHQHAIQIPGNSGKSVKVSALKLRDVCEAFLEVPEDVMISVEKGDTFDLRSVQIKKHVPDTKAYRIFTYKNPKSKRIIKVLKCDHQQCDKWFRKWHNFFDHLRIHTNERPYKCEYPGCDFSFTQKANLNKHMEVHGGKKRFQCSLCSKSFYTNFNLKVRIKSKNNHFLRAT